MLVLLCVGLMGYEILGSQKPANICSRVFEILRVREDILSVTGIIADYYPDSLAWSRSILFYSVLACVSSLSFIENSSLGLNPSETPHVESE